MINFAQMDVAVKTGAGWIDQEKPEWWKTVSLEELNMGDSYTCIIGQTYGAYGSGMREIHGGGRYGASAAHTHIDWSIEHGFVAPSAIKGDQDYMALTGDQKDAYHSKVNEEYDYLAKLWEVEIQERRMK
jgi:hypothetical protein